MAWRWMMVGLACSVAAGQQQYPRHQQHPQIGSQPQQYRPQQRQSFSEDDRELDRSFPPVYYLTSAKGTPDSYANGYASAAPPSGYAAPPPRKKRFFWDTFFRPRQRTPSKTYASTVGAAQRAVYKLRGPNGVWP